MKIKKTEEFNKEETDEAFAQADNLLKKITGLYMKLALLQKDNKDMTELVLQISSGTHRWIDKMKEIIQKNIMDYISTGQNSDAGWVGRLEMVREEIGNKSFYDIKMPKEDLEMMNKLNKDYEMHMEIMTDVFERLRLLKKVGDE